MDVAVRMLEHIDSLPGIRVKKTGWQNGFGLKIDVWVPIEGENLVAMLLTDGSEIEFCRVTGKRGEFEAMLDSPVQLLNES